MAGSLVESLAADFDPGEFRDEYREGVLDLLERKLNGEDVIAPEPEAVSDETGKVVDLMAALQESVRRSKAARTEPAGAEDDDQADAGGSAAKQKPAKKAAQKPAAPRRKTGT
jgi:DNA end-binding protein Ku